ncbi:MAG: hypothetical protein JNN16_17060 [Nitrospira sp.]|nr:hypothetical protein [Nitrospira sp.]
MSTRTSLLPPDALSGVRLGISVSESPDLLRLGLLETHFRLALGEIARCVLVSGGHLAYGGHLKPDGYTPFLVQELERYSRRDRPLRVCLASTEHRRMSLSALEAEKRRLGLYGEIVCLDPDGYEIDATVGRSEALQTSVDETTQQRGLSGLRRYMSRNTHGRVLIGGKREGFQGEMPGLLEEALFAVEHGQPIYLAGGFGGMTWDIVVALGIDDGNLLPRLPNAAPSDPRVGAGLSSLTNMYWTMGKRSLENGLTWEENQRLAVCYRPSEIAALVSLGLGKRFRRENVGRSAQETRP